MYFLFSGEGASDLGVGLQAGVCEGENYLQGPLALIVDMIFQAKLNYSLFDYFCGFVSKTELKQEVDKLKPLKKFRIPRGDIKHEQGTKYFRNNARVSAIIAKRIAKERKDDVIVILFRDSDTTDFNEWAKKRDSILNGFLDENFNNGIPMLPRPVSEAWLLCAIYRQENQNTNCDYLEEIKHGGKSEHALKIQLEEKIGQSITRELLNEYVKTGKITYTNINLPGFNDFQQRLTEIL